MGKVGEAVSLTLNGTKFAIPKDTTPNIIEGGQKASDTQDFGDGSSDTYFTNVPAKITGLKVKVPPALDDAWKAACSTADIPIILECISRTYEMTGSVIGAETEIDATKLITNEFECRCTDGAGIRKS